MDNLDKIIADGMFWAGASYVVLSIAVGIRNFVKEIKECTYYDNTGLLDNYHPKKSCSKPQGLV
ncbi:MAG: hypothetical protein V1886_01025 [archaeon]